MNGNTDTSKKSAAPQPSQDLNSESPARWVIHCICCETPVEPWQTSGYEFGYCADCYDLLMAPTGQS